jgi:hypothetical protein
MRDRYQIGTVVMNAADEPCHCDGGQKHWHMVEVIWNGEKWVNLNDVFPLLQHFLNNPEAKPPSPTQGSPAMSANT